VCWPVIIYVNNDELELRTHSAAVQLCIVRVRYYYYYLIKAAYDLNLIFLYIKHLTNGDHMKLKHNSDRSSCVLQDLYVFSARLARIRDHTHAVKAKAIFVSPGQCLLTARVSINTW
jgi:hypothetical protein